MMSDGLQQVFKNPIKLNLERFKYRMQIIETFKDIYLFGIDPEDLHDYYWNMVAEYFTHE